MRGSSTVRTVRPLPPTICKGGYMGGQERFRAATLKIDLDREMKTCYFKRVYLIKDI